MRPRNGINVARGGSDRVTSRLASPRLIRGSDHPLVRACSVRALRSISQGITTVVKIEPFNPWIPKVRFRGDSTKVGSKVTPQEKLIFPRNINESL